MLELRLKVEKTELKVVSMPEPFTEGLNNYAKVIFEFGPDWDGLGKLATFKSVLDQQSVTVNVSNNECIIAYEALKYPQVEISVIGRSQDTTIASTVLRFDVKRNLGEGGSPQPSSPDVFDQILEASQAAEDTANKVYEDAQAGKFNGKSATVNIGTVTTGAAGSNASVTNSGTETDAVLDFVIPRGADGSGGGGGVSGDYLPTIGGTLTGNVTVDTGTAEPNVVLKRTVDSSPCELAARIDSEAKAGLRYKVSGSTVNELILEQTQTRFRKPLNAASGGVPMDGAEGQVLTKNASGHAWSDLPAIVEPTADRLREIMSVPAIEVQGETAKLKAPDETPVVLGIDGGGTGAETAEQAIENLGAAAKSHKHEIDDVNGLRDALQSSGGSGSGGGVGSLIELGVTATAEELNYMDGVTSNVQEQLDGKASSSHNHTKADITDFPTSMPASDVSAWAKADSKPLYTAEEVGAAPSTHKHEISDVNGLQGALDGKANSSHEHSASDITSGTLSADRLPDLPVDKLSGIIQADNLPSYVDDVVEGTLSTFPPTGESGKIYIDTQTNLSYRWGGSDYVEIVGGIALGETSATAYRGDRGKIAYDHSQATGNPHGTTINDIDGLQDKLSSKVDKIAGIIHAYAGDQEPEGYLMCNGDAVSRTAYAELFAVIGTTYGIGDGRTTFTLPDLRGRVPIAQGILDGQYTFTRGEYGGEVEHILSPEEAPETIPLWYGKRSVVGQKSTLTNTALWSTGEHFESLNLDVDGGGQPHNNMPPYLVVRYIISTGK